MAENDKVVDKYENYVQFHTDHVRVYRKHAQIGVAVGALEFNPLYWLGLVEVPRKEVPSDIVKFSNTWYTYSTERAPDGAKIFFQLDTSNLN